MVNEGVRVVCVVQVPGGRGYWAPKVYEARRRQQDGVLTWRCVDLPLGTFLFHGHRMVVGFRSASKADRAGEQIANDLGIQFLRGVRHGKRC